MLVDSFAYFRFVDSPGIYAIRPHDETEVRVSLLVENTWGPDGHPSGHQTRRRYSLFTQYRNFIPPIVGARYEPYVPVASSTLCSPPNLFAYLFDPTIVLFLLKDWRLQNLSKIVYIIQSYMVQIKNITLVSNFWTFVCWSSARNDDTLLEKYTFRYDVWSNTLVAPRSENNSASFKETDIFFLVTCPCFDWVLNCIQGKQFCLFSLLLCLVPAARERDAR